MNEPIRMADAPWIRRFAVRTPTLPPATHTNTYVVGEESVVVVDPASPWSEEQAALDAWLEEVGLPIAGILLTHHHLDHVSGATHLAERVGAPIYAHPVTAALLKDRLVVSRTVEEGDRLPFGPAGLLALHTPGHAPGHLVYVDEPSRTIVAGDMVASVGTIIVDPPEGDMRLYLASLARLRTLAPRRLLPSHGEPVEGPEAADGLLAFYIAHRMQREGRVVEALALGDALVEDLVPRAYPDVSPHLYPLAARSLLAHLIKLRDEGRAGERDGVWSTKN